MAVPALQGCKFGSSNKLEYVRIVPPAGSSVDYSGGLIASRCARTQLSLVGTFTKGGKQNFAFEPATEWTSSNPDVISVSDGSGDLRKGVITPHKLGTVTITGDFMTLKDSLTVRVFQSEVRITPSASTLAAGTAQRMYALEILTAPAGVSHDFDYVRNISKLVTWRAQGPVTVDNSGSDNNKVDGWTTAKSPGSGSGEIAQVTATPDVCTGLKA